MKKSKLLAGAILLFGFTLVSCEQDYVCKCDKTYTGEDGHVTTDYSTYTYRDNRLGAEERCDDNNTTGSDIFGDYSINCSIQ